MPNTSLQEFWQFDFDLNPIELRPEISADVQQTLARLVAWTDNDPQFVRVRASKEGAIHAKPVVTLDDVSYSLVDDNKLESEFNLALAAGGGMAVWDPTSGKRIFMKGLTFTSSAAGRISLLDEATTIADFRVGADTQFTLDMGNGGYPFSAIDNRLILSNQTGGIIELFGTAWGLEID